MPKNDHFPPKNSSAANGRFRRGRNRYGQNRAPISKNVLSKNLSAVLITWAICQVAGRSFLVPKTTYCRLTDYYVQTLWQQTLIFDAVKTTSDRTKCNFKNAFRPKPRHLSFVILKMTNCRLTHCHLQTLWQQIVIFVTIKTIMDGTKRDVKKSVLFGNSAPFQLPGPSNG